MSYRGPLFATIVATLVAMVLPLTAMDQLPLLRAVDLDIGETDILELADGQEATVALPGGLSRTRQTGLFSAVIEATSDHSEASASSQLRTGVPTEWHASPSRKFTTRRGVPQ